MLVNYLYGVQLRRDSFCNRTIPEESLSSVSNENRSQCEKLCCFIVTIIVIRVNDDKNKKHNWR